MPSNIEVPLLYPGVSTKQMFLSTMHSLALRRLVTESLSSCSCHHCGYGFVLAYISDTFLVGFAWVLLGRDFDLPEFPLSLEVEGGGST